MKLRGLPRKAVIAHLLWAVVTTGALMLGAQLADTGQEEDFLTARIPNSIERTKISEEVEDSEAHVYVPLPGVKPTKPADLVPLAGQAKSMTGLMRSRNRQAAQRLISRDASAAMNQRGPLGKREITSLIAQAVKGSKAVDRRRAFDRILEEMQSSTFNREQAFMMRGAMAQAGVDGKLWQLFDYSWGANDPATAIAHLDEIPDHYFEGFLGNMIPGLASVDPQAAIEVFSGLEPEVASRVERRLLEGLVDNDVMVATDFIFETTDLANFDWRPMDTLTREIVRDSGMTETLEWAAELPDGPLRSSAWSAAYAAWAAQNPEGAIESIMAMDTSHERNMALNGFTAAFAHSDGSLAVEWANEISEPRVREGALMRAFRQFHRQDPRAAAQSFVSIDLPPNVWQEATGQAWSGVNSGDLGGAGGAAAGSASPEAN